VSGADFILVGTYQIPEWHVSDACVWEYTQLPTYRASLADEPCMVGANHFYVCRVGAIFIGHTNSKRDMFALRHVGASQAPLQHGLLGDSSISQWLARSNVSTLALLDIEYVGKRDLGSDPQVAGVAGSLCASFSSAAKGSGNRSRLE